MLKPLSLGALLALGTAAGAWAQQTTAPAAAAPAEAPETEPTGAAPADAAPAAEAPAAEAPAAEAPAADAPAEAPGADAPAGAPAAEALADQPSAMESETVEVEEANADEKTAVDEVGAGDAAAAGAHGADAGDPAHGAAEDGGGGHGAAHVEDYAFSFEGPFGTYDQHQLQRGLQVYTEICAGCHGLQYVPIRTLSDETGPGMPEDQVRAYAANYEVWDPALGDNGDFRTATPNDNFPRSGLAGAPDLSLIAKARAGFHGPYGLGLNQLFRGMGGAEYLASLLTGYTGETKEEAGVTLYANTAFPGGWLSMPPPLMGDDVAYADGHPADLEHVAEDVSAFLMWTAEPKLPARKQAGFTAVLMLGVLTVLLYLTNKRIWAPVKRRSLPQG